MDRLRILSHRLGKWNAIALTIISSTLLWLAYSAGLLAVWTKSEEYSHGPLVLLVLGYLLYKRRHSYVTHQTSGAVAFFPVIPFAAFLLGALIGSPQLEMYAVWFFLVGLTAALGGIALLRQLAVPLLIAFMVIPLPYGMETALTAKLQLVSSQVGVWFIRLFGGVVHLQGNVIDMGGIKLLVAEACAGLRYLYPLMSLGALAGYLLRGPLWMRWTLFLATVPITVFMNSLRIGATGILVDRWGLAHTEGFLHFFEGWLVFIVALAVLLLLAKLLLWLQPGSPSLSDALAFDSSGQPSNAPRGARPHFLALPAAALAASLSAVLGPVLAERGEFLPEHRPLAEFPVRIGEWVSSEYRLPPVVESVAGATEYYYADYASPAGPVNLYVSYYATQRQGQIPHSPRVCIPGDGWTIESIESLTLNATRGATINANRLLIKKGDKTMVAYYWLKQGRNTYRNELVAKAGLLRSSLLDRRTDGALVRVVAELRPNESLADVDHRLTLFTSEFGGVLPLFVPD